MSQHVVGSRLTSNIKITLKIKFTSQIFADISRSLVVVLQHLRFCKKILILIFFSDLFSIECKFFCPNSADNTMENRAISLVESSRDNSLISCPTSSELALIILILYSCQSKIQNQHSDQSECSGTQLPEELRMCSFWAGGISSFPFSRAREYRLLRRLTNA